MTQPRAHAPNSFVTTTDGIDIFYKDWGSGQPLFFHHGWPLSADDWDAQRMFFLSRGFRVIAHDRRGHGRSTQTANGHDMDTYAAVLRFQPSGCKDLGGNPGELVAPGPDGCHHRSI